MVEEPPFAAELHDAVVRGPADDRGEDLSLVGERPVGAVADGVAQEVRVAGRVAEVILSAPLVDPGCLEEFKQDFMQRYNDTGGGFFKIPEDQVTLSEGVLEQNPGWGDGTTWAKGDLPYTFK